MKRRGQVTLFIIVTVVLIAVILIIFAIATKTNLIRIGQGKISPEVQPIYDALNDCIEQRAIDAIWLVGLQGGYTSTPKNKVKVGNFNIAYGLYNNQNTLVSLSKIENEISNYIKLTSQFCINEQDFLQLTISQKSPNAKTKINQDSVEISTTLPLSITKDDNTFTLDRDYEISIPIRLLEIHTTANNIIQKHLEDPEFIDLTYLTSLDFDVIFTQYDENTLIYTITDSESELDEIPYSFMFVVEGKQNET